MKILKNLRNYFNITQDELSKKLDLETNTITLYEAEKLTPSFKISNKIIKLYEISYDYLILDNKCLFPKNLKLLRLAKKLDNLFESEARNTIESNAKSFIGKKINQNISLKSDSIEIELKNDFHSNLKNIRNHKKLSQENLGNLINISRTLLSKYELKNYPPIERLIKLSKILNISIHALATGEKLFFDFQDRPFGRIILLADHFLSLEDHKILIKLMENIINQPSPS
ncbi:MAG: helix-turn-helix transcriptional regulator [Spirochaetes bacterium]|nr:helix-turn-helix transcriptional regulator [Spirochaetota bacterium]